MPLISDLKSCGSGAVPVPSFWRHVSALHADSDIGFAKEYEEVQRLSQSKECDFPFDHCKHPENKIKNRYLNIVACECTDDEQFVHRSGRPTHLLVSNLIHIARHGSFSQCIPELSKKC